MARIIKNVFGHLGDNVVSIFWVKNEMYYSLGKDDDDVMESKASKVMQYDVST